MCVTLPCWSVLNGKIHLWGDDQDQTGGRHGEFLTLSLPFSTCITDTVQLFQKITDSEILPSSSSTSRAQRQRLLHGSNLNVKNVKLVHTFMMNWSSLWFMNWRFMPMPIPQPFPWFFGGSWGWWWTERDRRNGWNKCKPYQWSLLFPSPLPSIPRHDAQVVQAASSPLMGEFTTCTPFLDSACLQKTFKGNVPFKLFLKLGTVQECNPSGKFTTSWWNYHLDCSLAQCPLVKAMVLRRSIVQARNPSRNGEFIIWTPLPHDTICESYFKRTFSPFEWLWKNLAPFHSAGFRELTPKERKGKIPKAQKHKLVH